MVIVSFLIIFLFYSEIAIGIPDENSRKQILEIMSRNLNVAPTFEMRQLARMTPGYVGADLASLLREAAINAVNRILYQVRLFHSPESLYHPSLRLGFN